MAKRRIVERAQSQGRQRARTEAERVLAGHLSPGFDVVEQTCPYRRPAYRKAWRAAFADEHRAAFRATQSVRPLTALRR